MAESQGGLPVVVKPHLGVPCLTVSVEMHVEVGLPVWECTTNGALHCPFERGKPVMQGVVKVQCGEAGQVGSEDDFRRRPLS